MGWRRPGACRACLRFCSETLPRCETSDLIVRGRAAEVLAQVVPQAVSAVTPDGQLPADNDLDQLVAKFGG